MNPRPKKSQTLDLTHKINCTDLLSHINEQGTANPFLNKYVEAGFFEAVAPENDTSTKKTPPMFLLDFIDRTSLCGGKANLGMTRKEAMALSPEEVSKSVCNLLQITEQSAQQVMQAYTQYPAAMIPNILSAAVIESDLGKLVIEAPNNFIQNIYAEPSLTGKTICLRFFTHEFPISINGTKSTLPGPVEAIFELDKKNSNWGFQLVSIQTENPIIFGMLTGIQYSAKEIGGLASSKANLNLKLNVFRHLLTNNSSLNENLHTFIDLIEQDANAIISSGVTIDMLDADTELVKAVYQYPLMHEPIDYIHQLHQCSYHHNMKSGRQKNIGWSVMGLGLVIGAGAAATCFIPGLGIPLVAAVSGGGTVTGLGLFSGTTVVAVEKEGPLADIELKILTDILKKLLENGQYSRYALAYLANIKFDANQRGANKERDTALTTCLGQVTNHHINNLPYSNKKPIHNLEILKHLYTAYEKIKSNSTTSQTAFALTLLIESIEQHYIHTPKKELLDAKINALMHSKLIHAFDPSQNEIDAAKFIADLILKTHLGDVTERKFDQIIQNESINKKVIDGQLIEINTFKEKLIAFICKFKDMSILEFQKIDLFTMIAQTFNGTEKQASSDAIRFIERKCRLAIDNLIAQIKDYESVEYCKYLRVKFNHLEKDAKIRSGDNATRTSILLNISDPFLYPDLQSIQGCLQRASTSLRQNTWVKSETADALDKIEKDLQVFMKSLGAEVVLNCLPSSSFRKWQG